jgi:hypothetical protein
MSKAGQDLELEIDELDAEIADDDYGFILGPDGELKSVFLPDVIPFKTPKNVAKILKMFGITDVGNVNSMATLH